MRKITVSVDDFTAEFLAGTGNASAWIRQAVRAAALAEAGRRYGEFERAAGLVDPDYQHALLRLHGAHGEGTDAAA
ncbi:MAG TPA: hypothetical protein VFO16_20735 [Pseudonocardiaceae bacterium]|nr:hypothetical protein [Pseudonocardiaceae bacterium]